MKTYELYDIGRTTHRAIPGMYEFIIQNASTFVQDEGLAERLKQEAASRELAGYSIPSDDFSAMCDVWVRAYRKGDFKIDIETAIFADTIPRFLRARESDRKIGILTSASREFTEILYSIPIDENHTLTDLVDNYFLGSEIGDKDLPETFAGLWEKTEGGIYAIFDDKPSVCRAAASGINQVGGTAKIYLVDRKSIHKKENLEELKDLGVIRIANFNEVID